MSRAGHSFPSSFFSLSSSKLPGYVLPAIPPAALLLAKTIADFLDCRDKDARWPLLGTAVVLAVLAAAFAIPEAAIAGVPGLPLDTLRPLAPVVGVASLAVAGAAFWRRESLAVATVALAFSISIAYLNATMLPHLDPLLSPRTLARRVQENSAAASVSVYRLHRAWDFGLDYYLKRDLPEWALGEAVLPALVATNDSGIEALREQGVSVEVLEHVSREGVLVRVRVSRPAPASASARAPASGAPASAP